MSALIDAIEAEARGDFAAAAEHYATLAETGSPLDRVGVHQALARCHERRGALAEAAAWRLRAARGYEALDDATMARDERRYLALVECRQAVQDAGPEADEDLVAAYRDALAANLQGGAEGLTHEALFAGAFFRARGDAAGAMRYYFDAAEALSEQAHEGGEDAVRDAAVRAYGLVVELATAAGRPDVAQVAFARAKALGGGPGPQPVRGP